MKSSSRDLSRQCINSIKATNRRENNQKEARIKNTLKFKKKKNLRIFSP